MAMRAMVIATVTAMATRWAMAMVMRLAGNEKGKGGLHGQWRQQCEGGGQ
jgi:hypothetical protein